MKQGRFLGHLILGLGLIFSSVEGFAEWNDILRVPEASLMGDAYTAYGNTLPLFYNPALLGRTYQAQVSFLEMAGGVTNIMNEEDRKRFEDIPHDAFAVRQRLQGLPLYGQVSYMPGVRLGPIEVRYFFNDEHRHILVNQVAPMIKFNYRCDQGIVVGGAYSWGNKVIEHSRSTQPSPEGHHFSIGIAGKFLKRESLKADYALFSPTLLNLIRDQNNSEYEDYVKSLGAKSGKGFRLDVGLDYFYQWGTSTFAAGLSVQDVGRTSFKPEEDGAHVVSQEMMVNAGLMWKQNFDLLELVLTADSRGLNYGVNQQRRWSYGLKFGFPFLQVLAGYHHHHRSYGIRLKFWPVELVAGLYEVDFGPEGKQRFIDNKRAVVYLKLFDLDLNI